MIFHIVKRGEWELAVARGSYAADSLRAEGFIHCSTIAQVIDTANRFYHGECDLVVLCIDEARVRAELKYEFQYPDFRAGYAAEIARLGAAGQI